MDDGKLFAKVVAIHPPRKDPRDGCVLLTLQVKDGEFARLALSDDIARNVGAQLLLVAGRS